MPSDSPQQLPPFGKPLLDTLERIGCGGIVLDATGDILQTNLTATRILTASQPAGPRLSPDWARKGLKALLAAGTTRFTTAHQDAWIVVPKEKGRELILHAVPITEGPILSGPHTIVILIDLGNPPQVRVA